MSLFAFLGLGPMEIVVIVIIGVLLFGRRLPEIGKSMGKTIVEFKKGMKGLEDELDTNHMPGSAPAQQHAVNEQIRTPQRVAATAPKFEDTHVTANPPQV